MAAARAPAPDASRCTSPGSAPAPVASPRNGTPGTKTTTHRASSDSPGSRRSASPHRSDDTSSTVFSPSTTRIFCGDLERGVGRCGIKGSYPLPRDPPSDAPRGHEDGRRALRYCLVSGDPPAESPALVGRHPTGRSAPCRRLGGRSAGLKVVAQLGVGDGWGCDHWSLRGHLRPPRLRS